MSVTRLLLLGVALATTPLEPPSGFQPYVNERVFKAARPDAEWKRGNEYLQLRRYHVGKQKDPFEGNIKHLEEMKDNSDLQREPVRLCGSTLDGTSVRYRKALGDGFLNIHVVYGVRDGRGYAVSHVSPAAAPASADAEQFLLDYCP